jgi:hypothetical protein
MMNIQQQFRGLTALVLVCGVVLLNCAAAQGKKKSRYVCDEPNPASLCTAANTCGSASTPCTVDVTKSRYGSNVKPSIPGAGDNQPFCVKAGTTVVWMSSKKDTGFMVSFGNDSPFTPDDTIMGGGAKSVSVKATTPGCYKYDAGAFISGIVYGMGSGSKPELIVLP